MSSYGAKGTRTPNCSGPRTIPPDSLTIFMSRRRLPAALLYGRTDCWEMRIIGRGSRANSDMIYSSAKNDERDSDVALFYGIDSNGNGKDDWGISLNCFDSLHEVGVKDLHHSRIPNCDVQMP